MEGHYQGGGYNMNGGGYNMNGSGYGGFSNNSSSSYGGGYGGGGGNSSYSAGGANSSYGGISGYGGGQDGSGGGGFFSSPSKFTGTGSSAMSQTTPRKAQQDKTVMSVFIKQLKQAETMQGSDSKFTIDSKELSTLKIVGAIRKLAVQSTNVSYTIDDSTGCIDVKVWLADDDDDPDAARQRSELVEGKYVRVYGKLQDYNGTRTISAFNMAPVTDFNEIAYHLTQVMHAHLVNTRGAPMKPIMGQGNNVSSVNMMDNKSSFSGFSSGNGVDGEAHWSPAQRAVYQVFRQHANGDVARHDVCQALPSYSKHDVYNAIEYLSGEGHLYTTIDEEHFQSTNREL